MRKRYYLIIALIIGLLQACVNKTDSIFDEPDSIRMANALNNYKELLVSSPNGWLVEYYPETDQAYGGFNLFFKFTEKEVTVKSDVQSPLLPVEESTSLYSLGGDMGATLNFDVYNKVLNFFSDPALPVGEGEGFGYEGDYEFVFMSGNDSEIILRGKKTKNTIRLTPFPSGITWDEYKGKVLNVKNSFAASTYYMTINGKAVESITKESSAFDRFTISYEDEGSIVSANAAYIVLPTGIRFYEPLTINGVTLREFTFNESLGQMVSLDGKAIISIPPVAYTFRKSLHSAKWYLSSAKMGNGFLNAFVTAKSQITTKIRERLAYAWIGLSVFSETPGFSFGSYDGRKVYYGSILFDVTEVEGQENQVNIVVTDTSERDASWYILYAPALGTFINSLGGKYNVTTTDPASDIKSVTITDPTDSERWLILTLAEVTFP